jgi:D-aspartate ligase
MKVILQTDKINGINMDVPAVILPGHSPIALTAIRSLGRKNIPVYTAFPKNELGNIFYPIVKSSRFIKEGFYFDDKNEPERRADAYLDIAKIIGGKPVLIPVTDKDMIIVSQFREKLKERYQLLMPDHKLLDILLKKNKFHHLAAEHNLPIPRTYSINNYEELINAADEIRYPCIVKPDWRQEKWHLQFGRQKVVVLYNKDELIATYEMLKDFSGEIFLQEIIDGKEENIYCSFTFLDENSEPLDMFVCRKLRQSPPYFGNTAMAESIDAPQVVELSKKIFKTLNLVGYVSIEFKKDPEDGNLKIIEVTPARINRQTGSAIVSGVDIPFIWYNYLCGGKYEKSGTYTTSVKWISELLEISSVLTYLKNKDTTLLDWVKSFKNVKGFEIYSRDDLKPILVTIPATMGYGWKKLIDKFKPKNTDEVAYSKQPAG